MRCRALFTLPFLALTTVVLVPQVVARPPAQIQVDKDPKTSGVAFSEAEFKELKPLLDLKNQPWTTIPWKYSLTEARKLAAETKKPIFMNVNTGNCLGAV